MNKRLRPHSYRQVHGVNQANLLRCVDGRTDGRADAQAYADVHARRAQYNLVQLLDVRCQLVHRHLDH